MRWIKVVVGALLVTGLVGAPSEAIAKSKKPAAAASVTDAQTALATLNAYRQANRLGTVVLDPGLSKMAQSLADACAKAGNCDHNTGGSFQKRAASFGYSNVYGAENLMKGGSTVDQAFAWWKASSVHNGNMLLKQATRVGFARSPAKGNAFWVLVLTSDPS